jgi:D-3-phosphoglycerate dehydrogenase
VTEHTVVVTDHYFEDLSVERALLDGVATVETLATDDPATRRRQLAGADALLVSQFEVDADVIADLERCAVVSRYGVGVDNVDVEAATGRGIRVGNAPTYGVEEVAVHTVALLLNLARRVRPIDDAVARGGWREAPPTFRDGDGTTFELPIRRFSTATVGFVGFGTIGRAVADRLAGFDAALLVADPSLEAADAAAHGADLVGFDEVIDRAVLRGDPPVHPSTGVSRRSPSAGASRSPRFRSRPRRRPSADRRRRSSPWRRRRPVRA